MTARRFSALSLLIVVALSAALPAWAQTGVATSGVYYPGAEWLHKTPAELGISAARLKDAIDFAIAAETKAPRDLKLNHYQTFGREPFGYAIGPIKDRGEPTGIIVHKGYVVAEWGEPFRVDMAHSVTKSFLSSVIGIAVDRGMIRSIDDTVRHYVPPIQVYNPAPAANKSDALGTSDFLYLFDTPHNRTITWDHLLRQTSDWEGTLWGKPDWADRPGDKPAEWTTRAARQARHRVQVQRHARQRARAGRAQRLAPTAAPGAEGNRDGSDRRVEHLALVRLREFVDRPRRRAGPVDVAAAGIGAAACSFTPTTWRASATSRYESGSGTTARSCRGSGSPGQRRQPPAQPTYGFMNWFLNTDRKYLPSAPASAFAHIGNGTNMIYVDPDHDLVAVVRWIDNKSMDEFVKRLLAAVAGK